MPSTPSGNVDRSELLLEIKRLPNASFMLIRDRLSAPNDTIVLDARALAIAKVRLWHLADQMIQRA
jgi:hypothetical protein